MANEFPAIWFDTFLSPGNAAPVDRELGFICDHLPVSKYPRLLDVACGIGRHAGPLAALGYAIVGIDRSERALTLARRQYPEVEFRKLDMFELRSLTGTFDGVLSLWQSFGYGDSDQNRRLLLDMRKLLRPGGRILLDIYNADAAGCCRPLPRKSGVGEPYGLGADYLPGACTWNSSTPTRTKWTDTSGRSTAPQRSSTSQLKPV